MKFMQFFGILNINFNKISYSAILIIAFYEMFIKLRFKLHLLATFVTLSININYLPPNI